MTKYTPHLTGQAAEDLACVYLSERGLRIRDRNYSCKMGEIDLIMDDSDTLVFVEVRHRKSSRHGTGVESVTASKKSRLIRTATYYLLEHNLYDKIACRFDVIATAPKNDKDSIVWIKDAFQKQRSF